MKVKFLVPEIDKARWAKKFKEELNIFKLKSKELSEIGAETICPQRINKYKNGAIPKIDTFLTICRFFTSSPDVILSANPKWIECEINCKIEDFPPERVFGVFHDTYYIVPSYKAYENKYNYVTFVRRLREEPDSSQYSDFHFYGTKYDSYESVVKGKIVYHIPYVNGEKTSKKIFSFLDEYKFSDKQLVTLLDLNNPQSITNRRNNKTEWTISDIYKLSWILNKPFEDLIEIDFHEETRESLFNPIVFLEHYVPELISDDTNENSVQSE